jgi:hypothetical protein
LHECAKLFGLVVRTAGLRTGGEGAEADEADEDDEDDEDEEGTELYYTAVDAEGEESANDEGVSVAEAQRLIESGVITAGSKLWAEGMDEWLPLHECAELFGLVVGAADYGSETRVVVERLHIYIERATGIGSADTFGKSDPFCVVSLNRREVHTTRTMRNTLDPFFDERTLLSTLRLPLEENTIGLELWDRDGAAKSSFLGEVSFTLEPHIIGTVQQRELQPRTTAAIKRPEKFNKFVQGKIIFKVGVDIPCAVYRAVSSVLVREFCDTSSAKVARIHEGDIVEVLEERPIDGRKRVRTVHGWTTAEKTGSTFLEKSDATVCTTSGDNRCAGWLAGKCHARVPWQRMWFQLAGDELRWFETNSCGAGVNPKGLLLLHSCHSVQNFHDDNIDVFGLQLQFPTRVYQVMARTLAELDQWREGLQYAVQRYGGRAPEAIESLGGLQTQCPFRFQSQVERYLPKMKEFQRCWLTLEHRCLIFSDDERCGVEARVEHVHGIEASSLQRGLDKKSLRVDRSREFRFDSCDKAKIRIRVATSDLCVSWMDALKSLFLASADVWHEGALELTSMGPVLARLTKADGCLHLSSIRAEGTHYEECVGLLHCIGPYSGASPTDFRVHHRSASGDSTEFAFRASCAEDCSTWLAVMRREMGRSGSLHKLPVSAIGGHLTKSVDQAPILDEDMQFVMFHCAADVPEDIPPCGPTQKQLSGDVQEVVCTVYIPVEQDIGSHGREKFIPFTATAMAFATNKPISDIVDETVKGAIQPHMAHGHCSRFAAFLYTKIGHMPVRLDDTKCLHEVPALISLVAESIQPRIAIVDLAMQTEKGRLLGLLADSTSPDAVREFPELQIYTDTAKAVAAMVREDGVADHRLQWQKRELLAVYDATPVDDDPTSRVRLASSLSGDLDSGEADAVIFGGWMMKKGGSGAGDKKTSVLFKRRNWKTRFVTISKKCLAYFEDDEQADKGLSAAKGGIMFEEATMEIFDAEDDAKRGHQFFLQGKTIDGGYDGTRDLVMCAQSAAEFEEWERLLTSMIDMANGKATCDGNAAAAAAGANFDTVVYVQADPDDEPHIVQCLQVTTVVDVVDNFLGSKSAEWVSLHRCERDNIVVQRRGFCEVLLHEDRLCDYEFVRKAMTTQLAPVVEITLGFAEESVSADAKPNAEPTAEIVSIMKELQWLRHDDESIAYDKARHMVESDQVDLTLVQMMMDRARHDPLILETTADSDEIWRHRSRYWNHPQMIGRVLHAVPTWADSHTLIEVDRILRSCVPPRPEEAIQLLDPRFWASAGIEESDAAGRAITVVPRQYAVRCLANMSDSELNLYMLQVCRTFLFVLSITYMLPHANYRSCRSW